MTASPPSARPRPARGTLPTATLLAALACGVGLTACGSEAKIVDASDGRPFAVSTKATFAKSQRLANVEELRITVRNEDTRALPDVAVTLDGLTRDIAVADNGAGRTADPRRPVWIVDGPPKGGATAYSGTAALGRLAAGRSKTFTWQLTPVVAGRHTLRWRVAASVDADGPVRAAGTTTGAAGGSGDARGDAWRVRAAARTRALSASGAGRPWRGPAASRCRPRPSGSGRTRRPA
jgi:hypothetical protein